MRVEGGQDRVGLLSVKKLSVSKKKVEGGLVRQPTLRVIRSDRIKVFLLHRSGNEGQIIKSEGYIGGLQTV